MLNPRAVKEFLREPRDSHSWVKKLSHERLDRALGDLGFRSICPSKALDLHQKACVLLGIAYPQFSFWLDMGVGKTRVVLELLSHFWRRRWINRALILVISDEAVAGWEDEIRKWGFKVPYIGIGSSSTAEKWQSVAELGAGVIIATYPGFNHMFSFKKKVRKKKKKQMKPDLDKIRSFARNLDAFVADESVHLGNHGSLGFQIAKRLSAHCQIRYNLAGIPFGRDPHLLWSQQFLVDRGETFGETLGMFRAAFFNSKPGYFGGYEHKFRKEMEPTLARIMRHRSISYSTDECLDLPDVTEIERSITLPDDAMAYFNTALEGIRKARGDRQKIENLFLRMRQMSSGFIGYKDDETGKRAQIVFPENPKLEDLLNNIEDMPHDAKFVIFHEFTFSGQTIMDALAKREIKAGWLWGGQKNGRRLKRAFDEEDPKRMKGLVVNHRLGAESLNLQRANYMHFYESPVAVIGRGQAERRCFRKGQKHPGFMFDYFATPVDRRIRGWHAQGGDLLKAIVRDPSILAGKAR